MDVSPIENFKEKIESVSEYIGVITAVATIAIFVGKRVNRK